MFNWIRIIPVMPLVLMSVLLGLAPFVPEPHLIEKLRMLGQGELTKPLDIFDLFFHSAPMVLLVLRLTVYSSKEPDDS